VASSPVVLVDVVPTLRPTRRVGNRSVSPSARRARCACVRTTRSTAGSPTTRRPGDGHRRHRRRHRPRHPHRPPVL